MLGALVLSHYRVRIGIYGEVAIYGCCACRNTIYADVETGAVHFKGSYSMGIIDVVTNIAAGWCSIRNLSTDYTDFHKLNIYILRRLQTLVSLFCVISVNLWTF